MATGCTHKHTEACGPSSAGCVESPGSVSVTDRDDQESSETWMDPRPKKKRRQRC